MNAVFFHTAKKSIYINSLTRHNVYIISTSMGIQNKRGYTG